MPKPLRDLSAEAREAVPFFRESLTDANESKMLCVTFGVEWSDELAKGLRAAFGAAELKMLCEKRGVQWTANLRKSLRTAFGMYSATADRDRFPHLHLTTQEIERRRRNIKRMGLERARPFLTVHETIEHEGGDKARAFGTDGRNADLQWLVIRLAEIFNTTGARRRGLGKLIRLSVKTAKEQADAYSKCTGKPRQLRFLGPQHYDEPFDREINRMLVKNKLPKTPDTK